jgi:dipeptidase E
MRLLLISNSTNAGEKYLQHAKAEIKNFLGANPVRALFIPYAGVTISYEEYEAKVKTSFNEIGHDIRSVHYYPDPAEAVESAEVIIVGGGNTFRLLQLLQSNNLIEPVHKKIMTGTPYIGWSAGTNVACPTICTSNDMPIVQTGSLEAFNLIPFQINPHYLDVHPEGYAGETREMRIEEFIRINQGIYVAGLREGSMFIIEDSNIRLIGPKNVRIFKYGQSPLEAGPGSDIQFLIQ